MIRVVVADDHRVVRAGIEAVLALVDDIDVVACVANGQEAAEAVAREQPDVVLMDLSMPVLDGVAATRAILRRHPQTRIVILTSFSDRDRILDAIDAGAAGYLLKDAEPDDVVRAIRAAARGEVPLDPRAAAVAIRRPSTLRPGAAAELTDREQEVLGLLTEGLANKQIARRLGISEKTVKAHLTHAFTRLGVTDRTQAALWAARHGLARGTPRS